MGYSHMVYNVAGVHEGIYTHGGNGCETHGQAEEGNTYRRMAHGPMGRWVIPRYGMLQNSTHTRIHHPAIIKQRAERQEMHRRTAVVRQRERRRQNWRMAEEITVLLRSTASCSNMVYLPGARLAEVLAGGNGIASAARHANRRQGGRQKAYNQNAIE